MSNQSLGKPRFEIVGWEDRRSTARRPQEAINELVRSCHFTLVIFKAKWGTPTGGNLGFTSGTEEELFTALLELNRPSRPMIDVWVGFMEDDATERPIKDLQDQMSKKKSLYYERLTGPVSLDKSVTDTLSEWLEIGNKVARPVNLLPRSKRDVLGADGKRQIGERLIVLGEPNHGFAFLEQAAAMGGQVEKIAYARALSSNGRIDEATIIVDAVIADYTSGRQPLESPSGAEAFAERASLLRRQKKYFDAVQQLNTAISLLAGTDDFTLLVKGRILDDLGLAYQKQRQFDRARTCFLQAYDLRSRLGESSLLAQSKVNLARNEKSAGRINEAEGLSSEAIDLLQGQPASNLQASAYLLRAQINIIQKDYENATINADRARSLNEHLGNRYGLSMSYNVMAQSDEGAGRNISAVENAILSIEVNESIGATPPPRLLSIITRLAETAGSLKLTDQEENGELP